MRLRELFEDRTPNVVAIMPGGFHPFHPGHKSLYDYAVQEFGRDNVYVAATNDTTSRPFPFDVKKQLAELAGIPSNRFIQVKSPFNALSYNSLLQDANNTALVFIRSDKDKTSQPLPDQVRKSDGNMGYLISYDGSLDHGADTHGYMVYGPTIDFKFSGASVKSASELRTQWPQLSQEEKLAASEAMYPGNGEVASNMLDTALGVKNLQPAEGIEETKVTQTLPKQIKVLQMPTPPQAPTGPDGTDENGTSIGTTPKGNRSVKSGAGTYIFTPKGKLMLYMTPKMGGLQQTHNIAKQTVTVNFSGATIDQKATYDMSGKLISNDTTSMKSGTMGVSVDKDKGATVDMTTLSGKKHSINSKDPKKYDKLAALKKDQDQDLDDFKKANTATLAKMGIKR
tara:strand:- start:98 stop:1288 length:1191 start_codon:yes stop_codon:yes gene_type:complete